LNIRDKILREYGKVFDPHNKIINSLKENNTNYIFILIIIIEASGMVYFTSVNKISYALGAVFLYLITIGVASYLQYRLIEKRYGSVEFFDFQKRDEFIKNVLEFTSVNLKIVEENKLVENLFQGRLQKIRSQDQFKKAAYLGIATSILPLLTTIMIKNFENVMFLTISLTIFGFILLIFSMKIALNEYFSRSKIEKIIEITQEIRLSNHVLERIKNNVNNFNR
jgi:hypothetical protein